MLNPTRQAWCLACTASIVVLFAPGAGAQGLRTTLPPVTVTAQKEPEDPQKLPVSITPVTEEMLDRAAVRSVSDAAAFAPNTFFNEFTARKLSDARFRGIGASPNNPSVTTYIDGVPQFNANSSSIELLGIHQIEFVRGPQSALYGRNTLGGLINITSAGPSLTDWSGNVTAPFGTFGSAEMKAVASGPLIENRLAIGGGLGYSRREGFTTNDVTGHDLDSRSALFGKLHLLWTPSAAWMVRGVLNGERARDGDYGLNDLASLRAKPFHASRNVEGYTHRDIVAPTLQVTHAGKALDVSATTGLVWWKTADLTDLDYTALPLATRQNDEKDVQFTQEVRVASAKAAALSVSDGVTLKWQAGLFVFTQGYDQDAVNSYSPFVVSQFLAFPISQHSPQASLDDRGVGVYGRGTFTFRDRLDATIGLRGDHENKKADLNTFYTPPIAPPIAITPERSFNDVSPQFAVAYRAAPASSVYVTVSRGFKAGGFNAASLPGSEAYGEEHSWNYEGGVKTTWWADRLSLNGAVFYLDWTNLQLNVPNPFVPGQFFIANAAGASSKGFEFEVNARPERGLDLFGGAGFTNARFKSDSFSSGVAVGGKRLANAPRYTADFGAQYTRPMTSTLNLLARAEILCYGDYEYDDANTVGQNAYSLTTFRAGVHGKHAFAEGWIRNAFDTQYVPIAFAYPGLAPSGFVGESGAPRTFGVRAGVTF